MTTLPGASAEREAWAALEIIADGECDPVIIARETLARIAEINAAPPKEAPPGASAMERADRAIDEALAEANTKGNVIRLRYWFARHVEQAEAEARAKAIEACYQSAFYAGASITISQAIRALAKPQAENSAQRKDEANDRSPPAAPQRRQTRYRYPGS